MPGIIQTGGSNGVFAAGGLFTPEPNKTSAYTAVPGDYVPVDTTSGAVTITLPTAPAAGTNIAVKLVANGGTSNAVTIAAGGADVFNNAGGATTYTLSGLYQGVMLQYLSTPSVWAVFDLPGQLQGAQFQDAFAPKVVTLTDGTTIATNAALGNDFRVTLTGNHTLGAPSNPTDGQRVIYQVSQDSTGSRTLAYNAVFDFGTPGTPTLATTASSTAMLRFVYNANATKFYCEGTTQGL